MIWTFASAVPIVTAYEALTLWAFSNGHIPLVSFQEHPIYFIALLVLVPIISEVHFYLIHRPIHWPPLYRWVHKLHHHNVNPGPWSGLAMHPVEHLLYFSGALIFWIIPAHPVHLLFYLMHNKLMPAVSHCGYDRIVIGNLSLNTDSYAHYLHHKYFECNYSDGVVPLDKWFGSFHDGSEKAQEAMNRRMRIRNRAPQN
jgi:sterol desaturase/sphingolipid hydroxylase (fatty acid hydroxylase superfamily)